MVFYSNSKCNCISVSGSAGLIFTFPHNKWFNEYNRNSAMNNFMWRKDRNAHELLTRTDDGSVGHSVAVVFKHIKDSDVMLEPVW